VNDEGTPKTKRRISPSDGRWLALIPVASAVLMLALVWPRAEAPSVIPLPDIDAHALRVIRTSDDARARSAHETRLPSDVLAVGTALRSMNRAMTSTSDEATGRAVLDDALRGLAARDPKDAYEQLKTLRAVQLEGFLEEVRRFEASGTASTELQELGGNFVDRMKNAGWIQGQNVLLDDAQRRASFKLVWTAMVSGEHTRELALSLDEYRALYTLYLARPHVPENQRTAFEAMRLHAASPDECRGVATKERLAAEAWRAEKVKKFGAIDASYPTAYALGVAEYRAGHYDLSLEAFRTWMDTHPSGPLTLRARNHWKAALLAHGPG
jgi:hypothetical protein